MRNHTKKRQLQPIPFCLLLLISIIVACFCTSCNYRQSPEAGELFLQQFAKRYNHSLPADSLAFYRLQLLTADKEYRFTPLQLLRLKQIQLRECGSYNHELSQSLTEEAEALALQSGNDSLLNVIRWEIFRVYQMRRDTTSALKLLQKQETHMRRLHIEDQLMPYYYVMSMLYEYHNRPEQYLYWLRKARPQKEERLYSWYNLISKACLKAGEYQKAIQYADSGLVKGGREAVGNSWVSLVKGEALAQLFRTGEALRWYTSAIRCIDSLYQHPAVQSYSFNQYQTIYQYAALLHQTGNTREAIRQLEKIFSTKLPTQNSRNYYEDANEFPIHTTQLLADCYRITGQKEAFHQFSRQADSLRYALNKKRMEVKSEQASEEMKNSLLNDQLDQRLKEIKRVQQAQYVLVGIIGILLVVITIGILWWIKHQRRLRELFEVLNKRHADWLEQHFPPVPLSCTRSESIIQEDLSQQESDHRLYLHILQVMKEEKPFLDPEMDLVTLSRLVATNRTKLSTALNRETEMNFSYWLAEYRVNYLIEQLPLHAGKSVNELYPLAGFSSRSSFFRQFRQVTGMTPSQYQAKLNTK